MEEVTVTDCVPRARKSPRNASRATPSLLLGKIQPSNLKVEHMLTQKSQREHMLRQMAHSGEPTPSLVVLATMAFLVLSLIFWSRRRGVIVPELIPRALSTPTQLRPPLLALVARCLKLGLINSHKDSLLGPAMNLVSWMTSMSLARLVRTC